MAINAKIIIPIAVVVVVVVTLVALFLIRPAGLGGGTSTQEQGGGGSTETRTETRTETVTGTQRTLTGLQIDQSHRPLLERVNESGVLVLKINNVKVNGYGKLLGNATVTVNVGGYGRGHNVTYSNTPLTVSGTRYVSLIVRIDDPDFAKQVESSLRGIIIHLYYEDPETGASKSISAFWSASDLLGTEETVAETPTRSRPIPID